MADPALAVRDLRKSFRTPFARRKVEALRGVTFEVCEITLKTRNISKDVFLQEADFTPSGVVRIAKLQKQGFAYIKP